MINLFETFNAASREIYTSFKVAGNTFHSLVIEEDGFLPDDCITPYRLFVNHSKKGNAKFFNEIEIPKYWEIEGNNDRAFIKDKGVIKANIQYQANFKHRIVKSVEWLDADGKIKFIDHYNKFGFKYAKTVYDINSRAICKTYFDRQNKVIIYENFIADSIILTLEDNEIIFNSKVDFIRYFINNAGVDTSKIAFNSLGHALFAIYDRATPTSAYLFWQEHTQGELPGNMIALLNANENVKFKVIIPDKIEYEKVIKLVNPSLRHKVKQSGYVYRYHQQNNFSKNVLTLTNTDNILNLEEIVINCPDYQFSVAAITEMSSKLMNLGKYRNVNLFPQVSLNVARKLYKEASIYLDINYGNEILNALRSAFDYDLLIIGYKETAHNKEYTLPKVLFNKDETSAIVQTITATDDHKSELLKLQKEHANAVTAEQFNEVFDIFKI